MRAKREFNSEDEWLDYYRHYVAAMSLQGMAASAYWYENFTDNNSSLAKACEFAAKSADALITALNQKP